MASFRFGRSQLQGYSDSHLRVLGVMKTNNVTLIIGFMKAAALFYVSGAVLSGCVGGSEQGSVDVRLGENPVAYVKRVTPVDEDTDALMMSDMSEPAAFYPGASLFIRDVASASAEERRISAGLFSGAIDIKDLSASYDGRKLLFALRAPEIEDADEDEQPTWNIWEYDAGLRSVRRVISNDLIAEEGQDFSPRYLPDGRIIFVSTRQRQALARLLDEGKPQFSPLEEGRQNFSVALHVMKDDGSDIKQISFNLSHDLSPVVMPDGRVVMLRWDNKGNQNEFNFYRTRPDGTETEILYGADSHTMDDPAGIWAQPTVLGDGSLLVLRRPAQSTTWSGVPARINVRDFININTPLGVVGGTAMATVLPLPVRADERRSPGGRFAALAPLNDGSDRYLAAWSPCRLSFGAGVLLPCTDENLGNPSLVEASPAYGLWIFDARNGTQLPIIPPQINTMITAVAVMSNRSMPTALVDAQAGVGLDQALMDQSAGVLDIRSVYDFTGVFNPLTTAPAGVTTLEQFRDPALVLSDQRRARFLRIVKGVLIPDDDVVDLDASDFGRPQLGMREIVGYVPIAPDGSVRARVPANVPLDIQVVDRQGRNILSAHAGWISVRPGETLVCGGCHTPGSPLPHGRINASVENINVGAEVTGAPFENTVPALFADAGETMAQVLARLLPDIEVPSVDMMFDDIWTDPAVRAPDASWQVLYADLDTPDPQSPLCAGGWTPLCRSIIHYVEHIQPIWDVERTVDIMGAPSNGRCSDCHTRRDDANALQVPVAQLELTGEADGAVAGNLVSYRELLFEDNAVALVDGAIVDALVPLLDDAGQPVPVLDANGDPVLDEFGDPVFEQTTSAIAPPMIAGRARSGRFFPVFEGGAHDGWLTEAELRLLSEWIDIGAQNYNDPFVVPQ